MVALVIEIVAAYYSITGLAAIFSGAALSIIIMGAALEVGKVVAAVWLKSYWNRASITYKLYLLPAVALLMVLTSMGIFGFLSKAHSDQNLVSGDSQAKIAVYDEKIKVAKDNIDVNRRALKQMDEAVDQVMGRSTDEKGADKAVQIRRTQQRERARLLKEIETEQKTISQLLEERAPLAAENRKIEAEVGPIKYIAALIYGDNPDTNILERAVRWVIIVIVVVFDPLALVLILAAQQSLRWAREDQRRAMTENDDRPAMSIVPPAEGNKPDAWIADVGEPPTEQEKKEIEALNQDPHPPGWMFSPPDKKTEPESLLEQHPYLTKDFAHFKDTRPLVAQSEDEPDKEADKDTTVAKAAIRAWKDSHKEDTIKRQRQLYEEGKIDHLPWEDEEEPQAITRDRTGEHNIGLEVDNEPVVGNMRGFGTEWPSNPARGDTFLRVDRLPSALYKYTGQNWIEIDKNLSDQYSYDTAYIEHLISKIDSGEYDPDLLTEAELDQIQQHFQNKQS